MQGHLRTELSGGWVFHDYTALATLDQPLFWGSAPAAEDHPRRRWATRVRLELLVSGAQPGATLLRGQVPDTPMWIGDTDLPF